MFWKDKEVCQIKMRDSVPQTPWGLPHYGQKHVKIGTMHYTPSPCLSRQRRRSGCFPAEPYPPGWL